MHFFVIIHDREREGGREKRARFPFSANCLLMLRIPQHSCQPRHGRRRRTRSRGRGRARGRAQRRRRKMKTFIQRRRRNRGREREERARERESAGRLIGLRSKESRRAAALFPTFLFSRRSRKDHLRSPMSRSNLLEWCGGDARDKSGRAIACGFFSQLVLNATL